MSQQVPGALAGAFASTQPRASAVGVYELEVAEPCRDRSRRPADQIGRFHYLGVGVAHGTQAQVQVQTDDVQGMHSIWQFSRVVFPPLCHGTMWSASICGASNGFLQLQQMGGEMGFPGGGMSFPVGGVSFRSGGMNPPAEWPFPPAGGLSRADGGGNSACRQTPDMSDATHSL